MTLRSFLIGGLCLSIAPLLLNVLNLPALALIVRHLGPAAYGQWITASALVASCAMVASLGLRGSFIRHIASGNTNIADALAEQLGTRLLLSAAAGVLGLCISALLGYPPIVLACVAICALAMVINSVASTLLDVLVAAQRSASTAAITFASGLLLTVTSVAVVYRGGGPIALAVAYLVGPILALVLTLRATANISAVRFRISFTVATSVFARSRGFAAQQLLNSTPNHVEALLLPGLLGFAHLGFFTAGSLLASRLNAIPDGLYTAAYPLMSRKFATDRSGGVWLSIRLGAIITAGCFLIAIAAVALSGVFSRTLFPDQPEMCQVVLLVTIWALPLAAIDSAIGYALNAAGADAAQARASVPAAVCNVILFVMLLAQFGIIGACIALPLRSIVRIVMLGSCCLRLRRTDRSSESSVPSFAPCPVNA